MKRIKFDFGNIPTAMRIYNIVMLVFGVYICLSTGFSILLAVSMFIELMLFSLIYGIGCFYSKVSYTSLYSIGNRLERMLPYFILMIGVEAAYYFITGSELLFYTTLTTLVVVALHILIDYLRDRR